MERPLQYSGLQVLGEGGHQEGRSSWDMLPTFEAGWSDHALSSLFEQIPATLRTELLQGLRVFDGIKQARTPSPVLPPLVSMETDQRAPLCVLDAVRPSRPA